MTAEILYSDAPNRASFEFTQQGGTPYYQRFKAATGGAIHIEAASDGKWRIVIDGKLHLLPDDGVGTAAFDLSGSMILRQTE